MARVVFVFLCVARVVRQTLTVGEVVRAAVRAACPDGDRRDDTLGMTGMVAVLPVTEPVTVAHSV